LDKAAVFKGVTHKVAAVHIATTAMNACLRSMYYFAGLSAKDATEGEDISVLTLSMKKEFPETKRNC
jgi:hypothetical protein